MKIVRGMLIVDFIIIILGMIAMVIFPSIMFHAGGLFFSGMLIYNWVYLKRKSSEIKAFYYDYYNDKKCAELAGKWSVVVSYWMLFLALFLIIEFIRNL